ncbi:MAG: hypothetical protein HC902_10865 [Calothrix sp. SM1_5_4]|nr:hypothetical protein [Calothrix sp. SM1_5_4]
MNPKDPFNRYYVKEYKVPSGPALAAAKIKMCREASGGCTLCNRNPPSPPPASDPYTVLNLGNLSHEDSRFCYFRVTPDATDVANTYRYSIDVCDYGQMTGSNEQCTKQDLQFYVLETNTQPYFTNAHNYGTNTPGTALGSTSAPALGAATATRLFIRSACSSQARRQGADRTGRVRRPRLGGAD